MTGVIKFRRLCDALRRLSDALSTARTLRVAPITIVLTVIVMMIGSTDANAVKTTDAMANKPISAVGTSAPGGDGDDTTNYPDDIITWSSIVLDNGFTTFASVRNDLPMVACELRLNAGAIYDIAGKEGIANLTAMLIRRGSISCDAEQVNAALDARGALLSAGASSDYASFSLVCLADDFPEMLKLLADVLLHPAFDVDEFTRTRDEQTATVKRSYGQGATLARDAFYQAVYPYCGYRNPTDGTPAGLAAITIDDIKSFYANNYNATQAQFTIVSPFDSDELLPLISDAFGGWTGIRPMPFKLDDRSGDGGRVIIVDMPATQANIRIGHAGLQMSHRDYFKLRFVNEVLGASGMTSRLGDAVRNQRGLAYSVYSWTPGFRDVGTFFATFSTKVESAREAVDVTLNVINALAESGPTHEEMAMAKAALNGSLYFRLETYSGVASAIAEAQWCGLGDTYFERMLADFSSLDTVEFKRVLDAYIKPDQFVIVAAGPADQLVPQFADYKVEVVKK